MKSFSLIATLVSLVQAAPEFATPADTQQAAQGLSQVMSQSKATLEDEDMEEQLKVFHQNNVDEASESEQDEDDDNLIA
jgi:hypothetical protein